MITLSEKMVRDPHPTTSKIYFRIFNDLICVDCSFNVFRNTSISMWVEITPTVQFIKMPHNITYLYTSLNGSMVGLTGNSLV